MFSLTINVYCFTMLPHLLYPISPNLNPKSVSLPHLLTWSIILHFSHFSLFFNISWKRIQQHHLFIYTFHLIADITTNSTIKTNPFSWLLSHHILHLVHNHQYLKFIFYYFLLLNWKCCYFTKLVILSSLSPQTFSNQLAFDFHCYLLSISSLPKSNDLSLYNTNFS